jgi:WXG100 family type VII secretion target
VSVHYSADLSMGATVVRTLGSVSTSLEEVAGDLRWRVARMPEVFEGEAALAFLERHARWETSYDEMRAALAAMRRALRTAHGNYHQAAQANTDMWRSVR